MFALSGITLGCDPDTFVYCFCFLWIFYDWLLLSAVCWLQAARTVASTPRVIGRSYVHPNIFQEEIIATRRKHVGSNLKWRQIKITPKRKPISQHNSAHVGYYKNTIYNKKFFRCLILIKTYVLTITNVLMMWFIMSHLTFKTTTFSSFTSWSSVDKIREGFGCALSNQTSMTHFNIGHLSMTNVLSK